MRTSRVRFGSATLAVVVILLLSACDTVRRTSPEVARSDRHGPDGTDRVHRPGRGDGADGRGRPRGDLERNLGHGHPSGQ
jgi:hypothetical protein